MKTKTCPTGADGCFLGHDFIRGCEFVYVPSLRRLSSYVVTTWRTSSFEICKQITVAPQSQAASGERRRVRLVEVRAFNLRIAAAYEAALDRFYRSVLLELEVDAPLGLHHAHAWFAGHDGERLVCQLAQDLSLHAFADEWPVRRRHRLLYVVDLGDTVLLGYLVGNRVAVDADLERHVIRRGSGERSSGGERAILVCAHLRQYLGGEGILL